MGKLAEFKRYVSYDPETGEFVRVDGSRAGCKHTDLSGKTYIYMRIKRKKYRAHRIAWLFITGKMPEHQIDHINGDGTDNRAVNLREVNRVDNCKNRRKPSNNTTGVVGVYKHRPTGGWQAQIRVNYQLKNLGVFREFDKAVDARKQAELLYGFHPNHGQNRPL